MSYTDTMTTIADLPPALSRRLTLAANGCWEASSVTGTGYGMAYLPGGRRQSLHRTVWEAVVGPIPDGMDLDHECHNRDLTCPGGSQCRHRRCANPEHLIPRSRRGNLAAGRVNQHVNKAACKNGHDYTPATTRVNAKGHRICRICAQEAVLRYRQKQRES